MRDTAKITLVQLPGQSDDAALQLKMTQAFLEAARYGSDLIAFPEYCLGQRIPCDHPNVVRLRELATQHSMYAIAGLVESHEEHWATTALVVDRGGAILGRYFKTHPASGPAPHYWPPVAGHDDEARGILGNQFTVFHLDFAPIGILQCYDGYFPEAWGCTSYEGAEIILWINGRDGAIEDHLCHTAAMAYSCAVGANISNGANTGFAGHPHGVITAEGTPESGRLFPRIAEPGYGCVHATLDLARLRWARKHSRQMHQRRPELYGRLTQDIKLWQNYPDIPWDTPEAWEFLNRSQL